MQDKRRSFLKATMAAGAVGAAVGAGLLTPRAVFAAYPAEAFTAKSVADSMKGFFGATDAADSADISVKAPDIAENGAVVPVTVETKMKADKMALFVESNEMPMATSFEMNGAQPYFSTRIKMGKTANVVAVVHSDGKLFKATKEVKVTIGGCGG